ncbi:Alpha/Beta hydrolase protein [Mucor mucedo]|uniref:Alpha/Beta hydrolase protein n=1 Tax=Mucor mucedo TaxID=29922 RepID=UPI0022207B06|nr:Alpha/Beta hydrolase protein [Mucor mucedo]KAI7891848.1 Alpha/Beta hydrolase protein [Mucor mucedo]
MSEQYLEVNGANLCYEIEGSGPYIVFVAGGNGGHRLFRRIRDILTKHFTVVLYDRRGYFRSKLTGPQDYKKNVEANVEDLYRLMKHITDEKFVIFGISGAGPIIFKYLVTYPETISKMIAHEPVYFPENFPRKKDVQNFHNHLHRLLHYEGRNASMALIGTEYFNEADSYILVHNQKSDKTNNWTYWIEHECCEDPFINIDLNSIKAQSRKLMFLNGQDCRGYFVQEPGKFIAEAIGKETYTLPGGHIGFYTHSKEFAAELIKLCQVNSIIGYQPKL